MKFVVALLACALLIGTMDARSRKRNRSVGGNAPGQFDYYILTLSWAPDWCAQAGSNRNSRECATGNHTGFVVHGLWPQFEKGGFPDQCGVARPVAQDIVNRMLAYIPDAGLIQHEWRDHGTCSGLDAATYFDQVRRARDSVKIPDQFANMNDQMTVSPADVERQFEAANPAFNTGGFRVSCGDGQLNEVRICFTKDLKSRACSVAQAECRSGQLNMLPPR
jgi:ribonuclease T2